jgi:hypothetical protein
MLSEDHSLREEQARLVVSEALYVKRHLQKPKNLKALELIEVKLVKT